MNNERIETNPQVMTGKPVIKGTRITVELVLRKFSEGATEDDLLAAYPHLSRDDIRAALRYAADILPNGHQDASNSGPTGNRRQEFERLKAARFPPEGKQERIAAARRAFENFRWDLPLSPEVIRWIAEDVDIEDL
jgi:uncharacterized protein (DUF433 family)